jgi:autotransporter-associated beta strand protein
LAFVGAFIGFALGAADAEAQVSETFQVTNLLNAGPGSLRAAIDAANASTATTKLITFAVPENGTINLTSDLPAITDGVTINGSTAVNLQIDGGGATTRIFRIGADTTTVRNIQLGGAPLEIGTGASLSLDVSADQQFDDSITDAGRLIKDGEAMLTLRGENDYTGGTVISKGTLRGDAGDPMAMELGSLQGDITNNAKLVFDQATDGTYAGIISGTGSVEKTDTGVVTFSGVNSYTGGTTISAGALRGAAGSLQGDIAVESSATVIFDQPVDGTYAGNLTGAGKFTKEDVGTLTLSGVNTLSGQSNLNGGALKGTFSSIPLNLATAAGTEVNFDQTTNGSYAGAISGSADVTKTGTGTLTLSGANSYTGMTIVSGGTLSGSPASLPNLASSMIANDATLILQAGGTGVYEGIISGTGSLTKSGGGTLTLANTHTFSGPTSVTGGRLDVNGSLAAGAVDVGAAAVLGGTGTIGGPVTVNGTIAPGSSVLPSNPFGTLGVGRGVSSRRERLRDGGQDRGVRQRRSRRRFAAGQSGRR